MSFYFLFINLLLLLFLFYDEVTRFFLLSSSVSHISRCFISNMQYRAEIGLFYNACQRFSFKRGPLHFPKIRNICPSPCHLISFLLLFFMFPIVALFLATIGNCSDICMIFITCYTYIYIYIRFICNLFWYAIACRKAFAKFPSSLFFLFFKYVCLFPF